MTSRRSRAIAGGMLLVAYVGSLGLAVAFGIPNGNFTDVEDFPLILAFTAFAAVGILITTKTPGNALGPVLSAVGLLASTGLAAAEYAEYAYVTRPGSLPGALWAAWYANLWWVPMLTLAFTLPVLLFPSGRPLSPRWRPVVWLALGTPIAFLILGAMNPMIVLQEERSVRIPNPLGVQAVGNVEESPIGGGLLVLMLLAMVAGLVSLVIRFRRSRGQERQQLKWFVFAAALLLLAPLSDALPSVRAVEATWNVAFGFIVGFLPASIGIAILRHRLYDIDRIINKTLVYGLLTALLGGAYAGVVFGVGGLVSDNSVVVAVSTLAVAALFRPARRRVQGLIDRRFYRRKYDAGRTLEAFAQRLRDEVDLEALGEDLIGVVRDTVQPAHASLVLTSNQSGRLSGFRNVFGTPRE